MNFTSVIYVIQHEDNRGFFWSNDVGWTTITGGATIFTPSEREVFTLPSGGKWLPLHSHEGTIKLFESDEDII